MNNEDKEVISRFFQTSSEDGKSIQVNHHIGGINMLGGGANMIGTYGSGSMGGSMGAAFMGVGLLMALDAAHPPLGINKFTLKNTKTGKKTIFYGEMKEHSWHNNLMGLKGRVFNNIPWSELD